MSPDADRIIRDLVRGSRNGKDAVKEQQRTLFTLWGVEEYPGLPKADLVILFDKAVSIFQDRQYAKLYAETVCRSIDACLGGDFIRKEHVLYLPFKKPMDAYLETKSSHHFFSITTVPRERKPETWANEATLLQDHNTTSMKPSYLWCIQRDAYEERVGAILSGHPTIKYLTTQNENSVRTMLATLEQDGPLSRPAEQTKAKRRRQPSQNHARLL